MARGAHRSDDGAQAGVIAGAWFAASIDNRLSNKDRDALVAAWADDAAYFKQQPGFISAQLHRGIGESPVFLNYAVWESVDAFRTAFGRPEFRGRLAQYPDSAVASPHLFEKLAVRGICVT